MPRRALGVGFGQMKYADLPSEVGEQLKVVTYKTFLISFLGMDDNLSVSSVQSPPPLFEL